MQRAIRTIKFGGVYFPDLHLYQDNNNVNPQQTSEIIEFKLTQRQTEVLELLGRGKTNKRIGLKLGLTESTVRTHLTAIFKTLNVSNRTEASYKARNLGLINKME